MKESIRGLRPSYKDKLIGLRTSVGCVPTAIEFTFFELAQVQCAIFHANFETT